MMQTHACSAPFAFTVGSGVHPAVTAAANAYLEHHRACLACAHKGDLIPPGACTTGDWYAPHPTQLCATGLSLFRTWERESMRYTAERANLGRTS